jgi:CRP/FNR family cyclic AMP-dependent transcriptional regulator
VLTGIKPSHPANSLLKVVREFSGLSVADLDGIGSRCTWHRYAADHIVLRHQDTSDSVFFIIEGSVRLNYYSRSGQEVILSDLAAGDMFGELAAIDGERRSATGIVKVDVLLAVMPAAAFLTLLETKSAIAVAILRHLTHLVRQLTERVVDFSTLAVRHRVHVALLRLAKANLTAPNQAIISPAPTHTDWANQISTHREAVTREIGKLVRERLIRRADHCLIVLDVERLEKMVLEVRG